MVRKNHHCINTNLDNRKSENIKIDSDIAIIKLWLHNFPIASPAAPSPAPLHLSESSPAPLLWQDLDGPSLGTSVSVRSFSHSFTHTHYAQCYSSVHLCLVSQVSAPAGGKAESPERTLHTPMSHDQRKSVLLSFMYVNLLKLGVEIDFYYAPEVAYDQAVLLKFSRRSSFSEPMDNTFVLLVYVRYFHLQEPFVPVYWLLKF